MSSLSFPGSDVLLASPPSTAVPGYDVLGLSGQSASSGSSDASSSSSSGGSSNSSSSTAVNPYQQTYDNIIAASNAYLQNSLLNGPPSQLPEYTSGGSVDSFAQLNTTLASLKTGINAGLFDGTGVNALA